MEPPAKEINTLKFQVEFTASHKGGNYATVIEAPTSCDALIQALEQFGLGKITVKAIS